MTVGNSGWCLTCSSEPELCPQLGQDRTDPRGVPNLDCTAEIDWYCLRFGFYWHRRGGEGHARRPLVAGKS